MVNTVNITLIGLSEIILQIIGFFSKNKTIIFRVKKIRKNYF